MTSLKKPASKSRRSRTRKPKFLSLHLQLMHSSDQHKNSQINSVSRLDPTKDDDHHDHDHDQHQQLNLFPLHPDQNQMEAEIMSESVASFLFNTTTDASSANLHGLLRTEAAAAAPTTAAAATNGNTPCHDDEEVSMLVRSAMRNRERDLSEEIKWVSYSEVVEEKVEAVDQVAAEEAVVEEVSSSSCNAQQPVGCKKRLLSLKLDYEEILNAWSDQGSLFINGSDHDQTLPQTVPQLHDRENEHEHEDNFAYNHGVSNIDGRVPEMGMRLIREKREASVMRYKEKRRSRLFSNKIRYEVRKLNAEKRPRFKGRFVKRS